MTGTIRSGSAPRAALPTEPILIVDDEAGIRRSLEGILRDEGFAVALAEDGEKALRMMEAQIPALVLLDIWMPGPDGIAILKRIKDIYPDVPVIMISGHATIATAITATRLGAADFIEKPLDLNITLDAVKRALGLSDDIAKAVELLLNPRSEQIDLGFNPGWESATIEPIVFARQSARGRMRAQKTLARSALLYGQGLHSGKKSGLILEPLAPNSGVHFVGVSNPTAVPAHVDYVGSTGYATTVKLGATQAGTIEHVMSALHAYGISNLLIKCNGEVPVLDGSARDFCALFDQIGTEEQEGAWYDIRVKNKIKVGEGREFIAVEPADEFIVEYELDYPEPVGKQQMIFTLTDVESYKREIAPARTFGFVRDIGALQKQGLALGGRFDNFVLIGDEGAINDSMRFPDEPVRHKILDAIGDLYLLGRSIQGKFTARMTGHSDNVAILRALRDEIKKEAL